MTAVYRLMNDPELADNKYKAVYTGNNNIATVHHEINFLNDPPRRVPIELPKELQYTLNEDKLDNIDWLPTNSNHDVFSKKLITAIGSVGKVDWILVPVHLKNKEGIKVFEENYQCVLYNEYCDCFDYENSEYKPGIWTIMDPAEVTARKRKDVNAISKFILKEPKSGFPPLFRLLAHPTELLISADCHRAISQAGIKVRMHLMGDF